MLKEDLQRMYFIEEKSMLTIARETGETIYHVKYQFKKNGFKARVKKHAIDWTNKKIGNLTAIRVTETRKGHNYWLCKCDCGNEKVYCSSYLSNHGVKSCGCVKKVFTKKIPYDYLYDLYINKKLCCREISKITNVSKDYINYQLIKYEIPTRTGGGKGKCRNNLIGKKFGKLTVIEQMHQLKSGNFVWKCECECGNITFANGGNLTSKQTKSCGCLTHQKGKHNHSWKGYEEISGSYWCQLRNGAYDRGLICDISLEYIWNLYLEQDRKCSLSNLPIYFTRDYRANCVEQTASLDRIDSSQGYIEGNVQWVHKFINLMKSDHPQEEFIKLCKMVALKC